MKIIAIGDPHGDLESVKKIPVKGADLILLTGDLGRANLMRKMAFANVERRQKNLPEIEYSSRDKKRAFMEAYNTTLALVRYLSKIAPVFTIYGNVESTNAYTRKYSKEIRLLLPFLTNTLSSMRNVRVINNRLAVFEGVRIGGLEYFVDDIWVKTFKPKKDYAKRLKDARKDTKKAVGIVGRFQDLDILVCHQPPLGVLDKVGNTAPESWRGKHAGSKLILDYIRESNPKYVFCGHIHEGEGYKKIGTTEVYNLGVCGYKVLEF